jgi:hypothetical protein
VGASQAVTEHILPPSVTIRCAARRRTPNVAALAIGDYNDGLPSSEELRVAVLFVARGDRRLVGVWVAKRSGISRSAARLLLVGKSVEVLWGMFQIPRYAG